MSTELPEPPEAGKAIEAASVKVATSPVTLKIATLLSGDKGIESLDDLNFVVAHHSALKSGDRIISLVAGIPAGFAETPQAVFLQAVVFYHLQHKKGSPNNWAGAYALFSALPEQTEGLLAFYGPNYSLLSLGKANGDPAELEKLYLKAKTYAESKQPPERDQLLGFLLFNYSRILEKQKKREAAVAMYIDAGKHRIGFYEATKATADETELHAAATQVWKIRHDWGTLFPGEDIGRCPVSEALFVEVAPLADTAFSVNKV